jgi:hypothetical protein
LSTSPCPVVTSATVVGAAVADVGDSVLRRLECVLARPFMSD